MIKEFVPYEQALALKKLRFKEECFGYYDKDGDFYMVAVGKLLSAPLYQQAFRWFRKKHKLEAYSIPKSRLEKGWYQWSIDGINYHKGFRTYEAAELDCLKKLIEIVKHGT